MPGSVLSTKNREVITDNFQNYELFSFKPFTY